MATKKTRVLQGQQTVDPSAIAAMTYNEASGAQKNMEAGRHLMPLQTGAATWSTNATTAVILPAPGKLLAIYNNAGAVGSITLGDNDFPPVSQAPGAVQATTNGRNVGIACAPNEWTYIACGDQNQVVASAATLLVYLVDDPTSIKIEALK